MNRNSYLIYNDHRTQLTQSQSADGDVLFKSELGVPLGWIFAFGARNVWDPGDDVSARGGRVGGRNPYETQVETAATRLEQAEAAFLGDKYLWPFLSPISLLRRKLQTKPKAAFIRVAAPWVIGLEQSQLDRWKAATAFAENCTNMVSAGRVEDGVRSLGELKPFCPFVPAGYSDDIEALEMATHYLDKEAPIRLALLMLGVSDNPETFERGARKDVGDALAAYRALPLKPAPIRPQAPITETASARLLSKISSIFQKK